MNPRGQVINTATAARYDELPLTNVSLFQHEDFSGCLLGFLPGQVLPRHIHEHEHEVFDVLEGWGIVWLDGEPVQAPVGSVIIVPAGVEHGFENASDGRWLIRATIHQRVYARRAVRRALEKRFGGAAR